MSIVPPKSASSVSKNKKSDGRENMNTADMGRDRNETTTVRQGKKEVNSMNFNSVGVHNSN